MESEISCLFALFALSVCSFLGIRRGDEKAGIRRVAKYGVRCTAPILDRCFFWEGSSAMCAASMFHFCGSVWEGDEIGVAI